MKTPHDTIHAKKEAILRLLPLALPTADDSQHVNRAQWKLLDRDALTVTSWTLGWNKGWGKWGK
jgi:hypothetical protein